MTSIRVTGTSSLLCWLFCLASGIGPLNWRTVMEKKLEKGSSSGFGVVGQGDTWGD